MDFLTHIFLPLTVAYVLKRELFETPAHLSLAGFGLLSDFDKLIGYPGLLHSFVTLTPICLALLAGERWLRGRVVLSPLIVAFILSHLLLDFIDGGPIWPLLPLIDTGIGLQYPVQTVFGSGPVGLTFQGPIVAIKIGMARPSGFNSYGFINGFGVASLLSFLVIYVGLYQQEKNN
jgi:hypothetical protein